MPTQSELGSFRAPLRLASPPCTVSGCTASRERNTHVPYCSTHRAAYRTHGHPLQVALRIAHARSAEGELKRHLQKLGKEGKARVQSLVEAAHKETRLYLLNLSEAKETTENQYQKEAAMLLLKVFNEVPAWDVALRIAAMYLIQQRQPYLFRDDLSFRFQLVRCVRKLASIAIATQWDQEANRLQYTTRRTGLRTTVVMGNWLADYSGIFTAELLSIDATYQARNKTRQMLMMECFKPLKDRLNLEYTAARQKLAIASRLLREAQ